MSKFKEDALLELCFSKKLSVSEIKKHFTIFYSSEPAMKVKEEDGKKWERCRFPERSVFERPMSIGCQKDTA